MREKGGIYSREAYSRGRAFIRSNTVYNVTIFNLTTISGADTGFFFNYSNKKIKKEWTSQPFTPITLMA